MKINFPILDEPLALGKATILAIEDTEIFASIVQQFYQYTDDSLLKIFDDKLKGIKESELMLVTDILGYDINSSAILKLVHSDLEAQFNEKPEVKLMIEKLASRITDLIAFECLENELDLEYDDITLLELIRILGVKIETQSATIFEKCFEILQIFKYLNKKRLLVFVNVGSYLTLNDIVQMIEYIQLSNMTVLFLEPRKIYDLPQYVLDKDYYLMLENTTIPE